MHYNNSQMKLDQLIGYFNANKINLIPPFQRGHVWNLSDRQGLLVNIVKGRPIPAIFLYKEEAGSQFAYNILDGKQRLESLILFIGTEHPDLRVDKVRDYFLEQKEKKQANFAINLDGERVAFKTLPDAEVRRFREYAIPTIEIDLDDETTLDEIINLFVDINQQGEPVKRFDIVKAIGQESELLSSVFEMVAQSQTRKRDKYFKKKDNVYTRVLQRLQIVQKAGNRVQTVDRMWERLVELVLYNRTGAHRQPGQVLKIFMPGHAAKAPAKSAAVPDGSKITPAEVGSFRTCFTFLDRCYEETGLGDTRLARDLPNFYTMVTTLLTSKLLSAAGAPPAYPSVRRKLLAFADLLDDHSTHPDTTVKEAMEQYKIAAARQTTHPGRRKAREQMFLEVMDKL